MPRWLLRGRPGRGSARGARPGPLFGACLFVVGAGFWWASGGDIRRWRDWRTITGQTAAVTVVGPLAIRLGMLLIVLGVAALGLYHLVDTASYGSWLHSH
ncbi:DUF6336 family protein [Streptomyces afghaniensis]|uniref:DUF6336 family protein n=1 Tax=Streptomyces afghaniensis TaxID=66865 RepID=UPI0027D7A39B|nr:DUF6336 family protein [Streptomyces afghaniensis]